MTTGPEFRAAPPSPHRLAGLGWILFASLSFAAMGAFVKHAMVGLSAFDAVFWRSVVVAAVAFGLMRAQRIPMRIGNPRLLLWRSVVGLTALFAYYWSLGEIPLGTATTLLYTHPLFTVLLSGMLLGERRVRRALPLAALAFVGVALILRPAVLEADLGTFAALASGFLASLAYIAVRGLRDSDPPARIVFWFSIFAILVSAPLALHDGLPQTPTQWLVLLGVGVSASGWQLGMTNAYRLERATIVGPLSYVAVLISFLFGLALWSEVLDLEATLGIGLVIGSGAVLARAAHAEAPVER